MLCQCSDEAYGTAAQEICQQLAGTTMQWYCDQVQLFGQSCQTDLEEAPALTIHLYHIN